QEGLDCEPCRDRDRSGTIDGRVHVHPAEGFTFELDAELTETVGVEMEGVELHQRVEPKRAARHNQRRVERDIHATAQLESIRGDREIALDANVQTRGGNIRVQTEPPQRADLGRLWVEAGVETAGGEYHRSRSARDGAKSRIAAEAEGAEYTRLHQAGVERDAAARQVHAAGEIDFHAQQFGQLQAARADHHDCYGTAELHDHAQVCVNERCVR